MNHFIVATHSYLAAGIKESVDFFVKDLKNIDYINAYTKSSNFEDEFLEVINKKIDKNIIIFTDLKGGSITQNVSRYIEKYDLKVISGVNIALILQLVLIENVITNDEINQAIELAREDITFINTFFVEEEITND